MNCCFSWQKKGLCKFTVELCFWVFKRCSSLTRDYLRGANRLAFLLPVREATLFLILGFISIMIMDSAETKFAKDFKISFIIKSYYVAERSSRNNTTISSYRYSILGGLQHTSGTLTTYLHSGLPGLLYWLLCLRMPGALCLCYVIHIQQRWKLTIVLGNWYFWM